MPPKISAQKTERLIAAIQERTSLYDQAHSLYGDFNEKTKLWGQVATKCGIKTGHEAKMFWKNLRDCYRICRNKMAYNPNGKVWRFYTHMEFLDPYIKDRKPRKRRPAIDVPKAEIFEPLKQNESSTRAESMQTDEADTEFATIQYWNDNETKLESFQKEPDVVHEPISDIRLDSPIPSDHESYEDVMLTNTSTDNSLKMFFDAMFASTSQFPQPLQRAVKNKIFAAVLEAEEEAEKWRNSILGTPNKSTKS